MKSSILVVAAITLIIGIACTDPESDAADADDRADDGVVAELQMDAATVLHHWQALAAVRAGQFADARHHVEHIIATIDEPDHVAAMESILAQIDAPEAHETEHEIEAMLAGRAAPELGLELLHLQMAIDSLAEAAGDGAAHHVEHFIAASQDAHDAEAALQLIQQGGLHEGEEQLSVLLDRMAAELDGHDGEEQNGHDADAAADRTITVVMTEFAYQPQTLHVQVGERVTLLLENDGATLHDITTEHFQGQVEVDADSVDHHGDADHGSEFHAAANAGEHVQLTFVATEAGEFELFCSVPGHRQLGMTLTLIVEDQ
jgi:uncharacterized cupredoxin-like copper-binding protein